MEGLVCGENTHRRSLVPKGAGHQLLYPAFHVSISVTAGDKTQVAESLEEPLSSCPGHNLAGAPMPPTLPQEDSPK